MGRSQNGPPRIEALRIRNFRALQDVRLDRLGPLTAFVGPNASGKSTVFDAFAFLSECLGTGLRGAWERRGRFRELRTRDQTGPLEFELKYRERPKAPLITYHLEIDEKAKGPVVAREWLRWTRRQRGRPFRFLNFEGGEGEVVTGDEPEEDDTRERSALASPEYLAVSTLGQLAENPRVVALRNFIEGWFLSYFSVSDARGIPEAGPQEQLSRTGDNLANVLQYLSEQRPADYQYIISLLKMRVPGVEQVTAEPLADGRLLLRIRDAPFDQPFLARYASDGTLKMLAYLTMLHSPSRPALLGIEEPENYLHPRLLPILAEECRAAAQRSQVLIATHSPYFVDGLRPEEVWVLERTSSGHTHAHNVADIQGIPQFTLEGAKLGALWMEGHFRVGDPLAAAQGSASV
ncbi:MAG: ATPase [Armatimonadetes bacterium]|nr:ATPase [Armatimonadota bacterium]